MQFINHTEGDSSMSNKTEIAEYSPTAHALAELRQKYENAVFPVSTPIGMAKAVAARRELREVRVNLEKLRKELKAPALERSRLIDAEAKAITLHIEALEDPISDQIKAEEQRKADEKAERERIEREKLAELQKRIASIREMAVPRIGKSSHAVQEEEAKAKAVRDAEQEKQEAAARYVRTGYEVLAKFVEDFGAEKEFATIANQIKAFLAKREAPLDA
jgi:hypothetical protein